MAYSSIGHVGFALVGLAAGTRRGRRSGVLIYMAIYLAMTLGAFACILCDAPRRTGWSRTSTISPACRSTNPPMAFAAGDAACSRWPAFRRSPASSPSSTCSSPPIEAGPLRARRDRRAGQRGRRLLLSAHRQDHVLRRPPNGSSACPKSSRWCSQVADFSLLFFLYPAPLVGVARRRPILCSDADFRLIIAEASRWIPAASPGDGQLDQRRGAPTRRGG